MWSARRAHAWELLLERRWTRGSCFSRTIGVITSAHAFLTGDSLFLLLTAAIVACAIEPPPPPASHLRPRPTGTLCLSTSVRGDLCSLASLGHWRVLTFSFARLQIAPSFWPKASCAATPLRTTPCAGPSLGSRSSSYQACTWRCATRHAHGSLQRRPVKERCPGMATARQLSPVRLAPSEKKTGALGWAARRSVSLRGSRAARPKVATARPFHTRRRTSGAWVAILCSHPSCSTRARRTSESLLSRPWRVLATRPCRCGE